MRFRISVNAQQGTWRDTAFLPDMDSSKMANTYTPLCKLDVDQLGTCPFGFKHSVNMPNKALHKI